MAHFSYFRPLSEEVIRSSGGALTGATAEGADFGYDPLTGSLYYSDGSLTWQPLSSNDFWRSGAGGTTLPNGITDFGDTIRHDGSVGIFADPLVGLDVNGAQILRPFALPDVAVSGPIFFGISLPVDFNSTAVLTQTTAGISVTLPTPPNLQAGRLFTVMNDGTVSVTINGIVTAAGGMAIFIWNGAAWASTSFPFVNDFWRSGAGATTYPDGTTDLTENIRRNGFVGLNTDPIAAFDVNGAVVRRSLGFGNFPAGGAIGTSAATVDITSSVHVVQVATGQTLTLPAPTNVIAGRRMTVLNLGTASFTMYGAVVSVGASLDFVWFSPNWYPVTALSSSTDFWRSGVGLTVLPDGTTDTVDSIGHAGAVAVGAGVSAAPTLGALNVFGTTPIGTNPTTINGMYLVATLPPVRGVIGEVTGGSEFLFTNQIIGVGIGQDGVYATGSNANNSIAMRPKGTGLLTFESPSAAGGTFSVEWKRMNTQADLDSIQHFFYLNGTSYQMGNQQIQAVSTTVAAQITQQVWSLRRLNSTVTQAMRLITNRTTPAATPFLDMLAAVENRRVVLADITPTSDHQFFGFGYNANALRYQVDSTASDHIFYAGLSAGSSQEVARFSGFGTASLALYGLGNKTPALLFRTASPYYVGLATDGTLIELAVPVVADFWRTATGSLLPDGTTDTTEDIRRNGFVGINVNPAFPLDVSAAGATGITGRFFSGAAGIEGRIQIGRTVGDLALFSIAVANSFLSGTAVGDAAIRAETGSLFLGSNIVSPIVFVTSNVQRARILATGEFGINTPTPTAQLHVISASAATIVAQFANSAGGADPTVNFGRSATVDLTIGSIGTVGSLIVGSTIGDAFLRGVTNKLLIGTANAFDTFFFTNGVERARILSTGNFGVNTPTPTSQLHVAGSIALPFTLTGVAALAVTAAMHTIIANNVGVAITVTLPNANTCFGRIYIVKRDTGSTGVVTINGGGAQVQSTAGTFAATTTLGALNAYGQHQQFQSDGISWHRIN